ncbi:class II aldolase/adducin family protein [Fodinicola feengrottensis]|uniref:Aldolase n=1 Tax=Fodinicola feengrottensis TaxID=435914 RepID=A0ABP4U5X7_9ACTN|nr:class II aldolase/adducin family protein [Fodinicola feengrottensis]
MTVDALVEELIEVGRDLVATGLTRASSGNLSARLAGSDTFVITGRGTWLNRLRPADFAVVRLDDTVVGGPAVPSTEYRLHLRTYQARPDANSVIHAHPRMSVLVDALGHEIKPLTLDQAYYLPRIGRIDFYPNGSWDLADHAAAACADCDAVVLGYHGSSCVGDTVEMAHRRTLILEDAATLTYHAVLAGRPDLRFPPGVKLTD